MAGQPPLVVQDMEGEPGRCLPVRDRVALPGQPQRPGDPGSYDQRTPGEGGRGRCVGVTGDDPGDLRPAFQQSAELRGPAQSVPVRERVVERHRRVVEGEQDGPVAVEPVQGLLDPGVGLRVQCALVLPRDAGVAHQDGRVREDVHAVDRSVGGRLPEQRLAVGGPAVVVARTGQHREGRPALAQPQQTGRLLVLGLRTVVRDLPRHQQRVHRSRQPPQQIPYPLGPPGGPVAPVQVQITDVCECEHRRTPPSALP